MFLAKGKISKWYYIYAFTYFTFQTNNNSTEQNMVTLTNTENNKQQTFKSVKEMSKITGLSYKFIKQHIELGEMYICDKLIKINETV